MTPIAAGLPRILSIEDDLVLGAYVHEHLGRCGFQVTWCQDGQEGLAIARGQPFDVVLMDILLPGLDGLNVLTQLRQSHATPVVLMSALGAEADRISGFRLGADDYLPKPFSMAELRVRIEASCDGWLSTVDPRRQRLRRRSIACFSTMSSAKSFIASKPPA